MVGCSENELLEQQIQDENAIAFDTYVGDNAQTRATVIDNTVLGVKGFGVNAYYTAQEDFAEGAELNFMQNTKVTLNPDKGDNGLWEYSPVKYWPNNAGDKVSFFAYGPYAKDGDANGMVVNGTSIDFTVASEVKEQVDLIYNTNEETMNAQKQAVNERIHFQFAHALSRISFTVEAAVDETTNGTNLLDGNTRINVKKVALVGDAGYNADSDPQDGPFYTTGTLNLLPNADERWSSTTGGQGFVFDGGTVDGDGSDNEFYHTVKDVCAENDTEVNVVQLTRFNASEPQRLLNDESYLMVIPQEGAQFKIYIEYDVISGGNDNDGTGTYDESAIVNKITSTQPLTVTFEQGKAYNFNLILGMTSVKFEASVADWEDATNDYENEEWLPENEGEANTLLLNTYAEDLKIGETVTIEQQSAASTRSEAAVLEFAGYDTAILTYNEETKVFAAAAAGQTSIIVSCEGYDDQEVVINVLPSVAPTTLTNKIKTVSITGGTFTMGNDYEEDLANPNAWYTDAPSHSVTVAGFQMGQYEVSVAQFVEFLQANSDNFSIVESYDFEGSTYSQPAVVYSYLSSEETVYIPICELAANNITGNDLSLLTVAEDKKNLPVVCSWEGAALFAESVGGYLPHEEEWEYAARGGTSGQITWWADKIGYDFDGTFFYLPDENPEKVTIETLKEVISSYENLPTSQIVNGVQEIDALELRAIGTTQNGNAYGLYDLHGNLQEWCGNYDYDYLGNAPEDQVNHRVRGDLGYTFEGDSYVGIANFIGVAFRNCNTGMNETGFRVAFAFDYSGGNSDVQTVEE